MNGLWPWEYDDDDDDNDDDNNNDDDDDDFKVGVLLFATQCYNGLVAPATNTLTRNFLV